MPSPSLTNIVGWWDGSDTSSTTSGTGGISQWRDLSGNARHLDQSDTTKRGVQTASVRNSLAVMQFTDPDCMLYTGSNLITGTTCSIFLVYRHVAVSNDYARIASLRSSAGSGNDWDNDASFALSKDPNLPGVPSLTRNYSAHGGPVTSYPGLLMSTWVVLTAVFNGTTAELFINGTSVGTPSSSTGTFDIDIIGLNSDSANIGTSNTDVAEFIVYSDAKAGTARTDIESYLNTKWGFSSSPGPVAMVASAAGVSTAQVTRLPVLRPFVATETGVSTAQVTRLPVLRPIAGTSPGVSAVTATTLTSAGAFGGTATGVSTAQATKLIAAVALVGTEVGLSTGTASSLGATRPITGTSPGTGAAVATTLTVPSANVITWTATQADGPATDFDSSFVPAHRPIEVLNQKYSSNDYGGPITGTSPPPSNKAQALANVTIPFDMTGDVQMDFDADATLLTGAINGGVGCYLLNPVTGNGYGILVTNSWHLYRFNAGVQTEMSNVDRSYLGVRTQHVTFIREGATGRTRVYADGRQQVDETDASTTCGDRLYLYLADIGAPPGPNATADNIVVTNVITGPPDPAALASTSTAGVATATATMSVARALTGTATGAGTNTAALTVAAQSLSASADGLSTTTAALGLSQALVATSAGQATAAATRLISAVALIGTAAGTSTATGDMPTSGQVGLAGTSGGTSTASATRLVSALTMAGTAGGASTTTAAVGVAQSLGSSATGTSTASAVTLTLGHPVTLAATTVGTSSTTATLVVLSAPPTGDTVTVTGSGDEVGDWVLHPDGSMVRRQQSEAANDELRRRGHPELVVPSGELSPDQVVWIRE